MNSMLKSLVLVTVLICTFSPSNAFAIGDVRATENVQHFLRVKEPLLRRFTLDVTMSTMERKKLHYGTPAFDRFEKKVDTMNGALSAFLGEMELVDQSIRVIEDKGNTLVDDVLVFMARLNALMRESLANMRWVNRQHERYIRTVQPIVIRPGETIHLQNGGWIEVHEMKHSKK